MQKNCLGYQVEFTEDVFGGSEVLAETIEKAGGSKVMIVADTNMIQRTQGIGSRIGKYVNDHGIRLAGSPVVLSGGERIKADGFESARRIMDALLTAKLGSNDMVLAIGGGAILDVVGYAAAQVRGGIRLVRMPTTPAAMIDAAFAGYAAVDADDVKDAFRVESTPTAVIIDTAMAAGVLDGVWNAGIGEAVRLAMASDAALFKKLQKLIDGYCRREMDSLVEMVKATYATRSKKGAPMLGVWSAARLESMSGYKLPHGYAVPIGLYLETAYSVERGYLKAGDREKMIAMLEQAKTLENVVNSRHLLNPPDGLVYGVDALKLATGGAAIMVSEGIGKMREESEFDREACKKAISDAFLRAEGNGNLVK